MKITYRPEIDGLRAIAVLFVIFYHAEFILFENYFLKGGFIGIDIFFVISGYLITSIILKEIKITGKFSFVNFYERRARRILPMLLTVMLVTLPFAFKSYQATSNVDFAKSILSSIFFFSNYFFYFTGLEYLAETSSLKPFLHTWSLSVEEQFYIIYPAILIFIYKFLNKYFSLIIIALILSSFFLADWGSINYTSITFYSIHSRFWELLIGGFLAKLEITHGRNYNYSIGQIFSTIGLFLIIYSCQFLDDEMPNPSVQTLPPIIGTALIIWFSKFNNIITKILSNKLLVSIGLISYSLYLWHFPVFAFRRIRYLFDNPTQFDKFEWIIFTLVLSILSYFLIEKPFRNKNKISKKILIYFFFFTTLITISFLFINKINYFKKGFISELPNYNLDKDYLIYERRDYILENLALPPPIFTNSNKKKVLIVGNSYGEDLFLILKLNEELNKNFNNYEFSIFRTQVRCFLENLEGDKKCLLFGKSKHTISQNIQNYNNSDIIILATSWDYKYQDIEKIRSIYIQTNIDNKKLIIMGQKATFISSNNFNLINKLDYEIENDPHKFNIIINKYERKFFSNITKHTILVNNKLKKIINDLNIYKKTDNPKIVYLDPLSYACKEEEEKCTIITSNSSKIYLDSGHYTLDGAKFFGKEILENNWLKLN